MLQASLLILIPLGMMAAGLAIVWMQSRTGSGGRALPHHHREAVIAAIAWTLVIVGLFAIVAVLAGPFFIPAWIVLAMILLSLLYRFRSTERRSLLWTLMLAAERNIPLDAAARAFASERRDHIGDRAYDLAEYLEAGLPLALALQRARLHFPQSVLLSAELGQQTGNLGGALRRALGSNDESEQVLRSVAERTFYLASLVLFGAAILTFMMIKIVPALQKILEEFGLEPAPAMKILVGATHFLVQVWPLVALVIAVLVLVLLRGLSYYTGSSPRYMPGIIAGWQRADRSVVMHWLAHAVRQNRPLPEMMRLMAGYLTKRRLRSKLQRAARRVDQGLEWTECLQDAGLIRRPETAVFRAAERTGNLAWALDEMAESHARRAVYRLRAFTNVAFPAAVMVLGSVVLLIAFAMFSPLYSLISGLS
ncbi:MAG: type II secretion system F family protein [Thermoguttaceae bacterium]